MLKQFYAALAGGLMISIGGAVYLNAYQTMNTSYTMLGTLAGAFFFSVALICICLKGYGLFTGKVGYLAESHTGREIADVGVTLRDGSDLAREVADVVLMGGSLNELVTALELGRGTMRRVHGNFVATMGLNSLFLAGGLVGLVQPGLSAILHNLTTLGVSLNAMCPLLGGR